MASSVDPRKVIFIPPQQLDKAEGEYRIAGDQWDEEGKLGERVVWVRDDDHAQGGYFESFDQSAHGRTYSPQVTANQGSNDDNGEEG